MSLPSAFGIDLAFDRLRPNGVHVCIGSDQYVDMVPARAVAVLADVLVQPP